MGASNHFFCDTPTFLAFMRGIRQQYQEELQGTLQLIWRTSWGIGCLAAGDTLQPLPRPPGDTAGWWEHLNLTQRLYNSQAMYEWDALMFDFWAEAQVPVLDLTPLWQRPDAMAAAGNAAPNDCAHLCTPGPLRFAVRVLQQLIAQMQEP